MAQHTPIQICERVIKFSKEEKSYETASLLSIGKSTVKIIIVK